MNRSRIIRSIIVAIFIICTVGMIFVCVKNSIDVESTFRLSYKFIYAVALLFAIFFYALLKNKLKLLNCKRSIEYTYRYIYLVMLILITRFVAVLLYKDSSVTTLIEPSFDKGLGSYIVYFLGKITLYPLYATIIINTILTFVCSVIIKRLVFNVTTNEMLSAIATILYIFVPQAIINTTNYTPYNFNTVFILSGLFLLLLIIDEVKQHKLKNKKYLNYTVIMGICILCDILFGGRFELWLLVLLTSLIISNNVGYVRVNSKREIVEKINSLNARKLMYKMEAIAINKLLLVSSVLILFIALGLGITYLFGYNITSIYTSINVSNAYDNVLNSIKGSCNYYILLIALILILEVLGIVLRRKVDTKTSLVKLSSILVMLITLTLNGVYVASMLDAFLALSLILNVGNIYYNRDEKIKLLKAEN